MRGEDAVTKDPERGDDPGRADDDERGLAAPANDPRRHRVSVATVVALLVVVAGAWLLTQTREPPLRSLVVAGAVVAAVALTRRRASIVRGALLTVGALLVLGAGMWIGANSPRHTWFGALVSHGPRNRGEVAVTFDDGPNVTATLAIAAILDAHDAKGTFFLVGKALDRRPDIAKRLLDDGHLLGNHSYHHDYTSWLDPRYPELTKTEVSFRTQLGVCPAFYRPPHGQHTPFMAYDVHRNGMVMTTWDVSAGDWQAKDARALARRILRRVQPGSVIDLHDGLDGDLTTDRTVVVRALPFVLEGLRARHLVPVRLDHLLGRPGYLDRC